MKLVRTLPHIEGVPEIFVFYCPHCKQAETKVLERAAYRKCGGGLHSTPTTEDRFASEMQG